MRREAEKNVLQLLQNLDTRNVKAPGSEAGADGISFAMKAKLQNAVKAMQEGLVERDTEVGLNASL
jgi:hypothetical protein